jgi:hypothetical protein
MCSRFGVRRAEMQPVERTAKVRSTMKAGLIRRAFRTGKEDFRNNSGARFNANFEDLNELSLSVVPSDD